jgi:hypothetical protein
VTSSSNQTFREVYNRLDRDRSVHLTIRDADDPDRTGLGDTRYLQGPGKSGTIRFNDISLNQVNFDLFTKDRTPSWMFTAASSLAHELGHANAFLGNGPAACKGDSPPGCILGFENRIRSELPASERGGIRTRYDTEPGKP